MCINICLYSLSYIWENGVSYCIKELCNLSLEIQRPFMEERCTPILRNGRKVPQWWTPVFVIVNLIWSLLYSATRSDRPPLSTEKISLCLSLLVPEICGHKVVKILHHLFPFCINFHLNFWSNWPPFSLLLDLIDPSFLQNFRSEWVHFFYHVPNLPTENMVKYPPHPRPFTHSLMHAHLSDNRKSLTTYCKHLVECVWVDILVCI